MIKGHLVRTAILVVTIVFAGACNATGYTARTAPDQVSKRVLSNPVTSVTQGQGPGIDGNWVIHANFPKLIEQNFASVDAASAQQIVGNLSDREYEDLARLYTSANYDTQRNGPLLPILADRLTPKQLGRASRFFGYQPIKKAILAVSPLKLADFEKYSSALHEPPIPGMQIAGSEVFVFQTASPAPYMNWTPYEVYLNFRTAPVGSLTVAGALYETGAILGTAVGVAYGVGYTAGTATAYLVQTYSPSLWNAIGGTVAGMVDNLAAAVSYAQEGSFEKSLGSLFGLSPSDRSAMSNYGGDYGNSMAWSDYDHPSCKFAPDQPYQKNGLTEDCNGK